MKGAVVVVVLRKSKLVIFFAKGLMKTSVFLAVGRESKKGVFGVLEMFGNDFSICDKGRCSFVAVDHSCSELVGISAWKSGPVWFLPFWDMDQD